MTPYQCVIVNVHLISPDLCTVHPPSRRLDRHRLRYNRAFDCVLNVSDPVLRVMSAICQSSVRHYISGLIVLSMMASSQCVVYF